ncbi:MAG: hypothetical protein ACXAAM_08610 [Candidatus Heimdallarchaeaceae archaeon]|jgi:hypothetical protein
MEEEALRIFYEWDIENIDVPLDAGEFKRIIGEDNDDVINQYIRDLKEDGLIETFSKVGKQWRSGRITPYGRQRFPNPYSDEMFDLILKTIRDYDYENMNQYMNRTKLKEIIKEDNDNINDLVLRTLEEEGFIEIIKSVTGSKYSAFRIKKPGRDYLEGKGI